MNMRSLVNKILEIAERLVERNVRAANEDEFLRSTEKMIVVLVLLYWVESKIRYEDVWKQDIEQLFEIKEDCVLGEYEIVRTVNKLSFSIKQHEHVEQSEMVRDILSHPKEFPLSLRAYQGLRKNRTSSLIYYAAVIVYYRVADYISGVRQYPVMWTVIVNSEKAKHSKS